MITCLITAIGHVKRPAEFDINNASIDLEDYKNNESCFSSIDEI